MWITFIDYAFTFFSDWKMKMIEIMNLDYQFENMF